MGKEGEPTEVFLRRKRSEVEGEPGEQNPGTRSRKPVEEGEASLSNTAAGPRRSHVWT